MYINKISLTVIAVLAVLYPLQIHNSHSTVSYARTIKTDVSSQKNTVPFISRKLSEMTLREKIGQMIISSTLGEYYSEDSDEYIRLKRLCEETKIGGFIFFKGTSIGYARLSNKLQSLSNTPLLISADFERGTGMRVTDGSLFPNNMAIGAARNTDLAYKMGLVIADESRKLGVHQNYAPVCDVNNNPDNPIINVRSFGEDPGLVSKMSEALIKGLQDGNVIATAKHFPGHGDTEIDSHNDLPILNFSMERLNNVELVPFKNAVNSGVKSVMIAHLSFPLLESKPNVPSSLSKNIVNELLIKELGFKGLTVTDALNMKGITKYFSTEQVAVMCVEAGIDLILMPASEEASINAIEKAVIENRISEGRIDTSVEKILEAKKWLGLFENRFVQEADVYKSINTEESNRLAQQIADESITLVKDENNILPLKQRTANVIIFNLSDGKDNINSTYFIDKMIQANEHTNHMSYDSELSQNSISDALELSRSNDVTVIAIYAKVKHGTGKISILPSQVELINKLSENIKNLVVISFGNPYLLREFPNITSYICAYGDSNVSINAAVKAIYGDIKFMGKLPITVNKDFKYGWGISK